MNGTVKGVNGHVEPGATVRLYAWPSDTVLQGLASGKNVPRTLLASGSASSGGAYSLYVAAGALRPFANLSGYANLEVDSGRGAWFFTRKASGLGSISAVNIAGASPAICTGWQFQYQVKKAWAVVGQAYIVRAATHVRENFVYTKGQSTTLGVGISPTLKVGSFSAAGSESESKTGRASFPSFGPANVLYRTLFRMALYRVVCGRGGKVAGKGGPVTTGPAGGTWSARMAGPPASASAIRGRRRTRRRMTARRGSTTPASRPIARKPSPGRADCR